MHSLSKISKKILAMLLTLLMVLTIVPVGAIAAALEDEAVEAEIVGLADIVPASESLGFILPLGSTYEDSSIAFWNSANFWQNPGPWPITAFQSANLVIEFSSRPTANIGTVWSSPEAGWNWATTTHANSRPGETAPFISNIPLTTLSSQAQFAGIPATGTVRLGVSGAARNLIEKAWLASTWPYIPVSAEFAGGGIVAPFDTAAPVDIAINYTLGSIGSGGAVTAVRIDGQNIAFTASGDNQVTIAGAAIAALDLDGGNRPVVLVFNNPYSPETAELALMIDGDDVELCDDCGNFPCTCPWAGFPTPDNNQSIISIANPPETVRPVDPNATAETVSALAFLKGISGTGYQVFGQQQSTNNGATSPFNAATGRSSDTFIGLGDYVGLDSADIFNWINNSLVNNRPQAAANARTQAIETFKRGGMFSLMSHIGNIITGSGYGDTSTGATTTARILPGGDMNHRLNLMLDHVAEWAHSLVIGCNATPCTCGDEYCGVKVPVIFRPWHEHNGAWFWWGPTNRQSDEEFIALWRYTVRYLRDVKGVDNFLYALAPNHVGGTKESFKEHYLATYPGDEYVDILGFDSYSNATRTLAEIDRYFYDVLLPCSQAVAEIAAERGKVYALPEFGMNPMLSGNRQGYGLSFDDITQVVQDNFIGYIYNLMQQYEATRNFSYIAHWANWSRTVVYLPFRDANWGYVSPGFKDLINFYNHPSTVWASRMTTENTFGLKPIVQNVSTSASEVIIVSPAFVSRINGTFDAIVEVKAAAGLGVQSVLLKAGNAEPISLSKAAGALGEMGYYSAYNISIAGLADSNGLVSVNVTATFDNESTAVADTIIRDFTPKTIADLDFATGTQGVTPAATNNLLAFDADVALEQVALGGGLLKLNANNFNNSTGQGSAANPQRLTVNVPVKDMDIKGSTSISADFYVPAALMSVTQARVGAQVIITTADGTISSPGMVTADGGVQLQLNQLEAVTIDGVALLKYTFDFNFAALGINPDDITDVTLSFNGIRVGATGSNTAASIYIGNVEFYYIYTAKFDPTLIDNFDSYFGIDNALRAIWAESDTSNPGGSHSIQLNSEFKAPYEGSQYSLQYNYVIAQSGTWLSHAVAKRFDFSQHDGISFWARSNGEAIMIQLFTSGGSGYYNATIRLASGAGGAMGQYYFIPFSAFSQPSWAGTGWFNKANAVNRFQIFVEAPTTGTWPRSGSVQIDDIRMAMTPEPVPVPNWNVDPVNNEGTPGFSYVNDFIAGTEMIRINTPGFEKKPASELPPNPWFPNNHHEGGDQWSWFGGANWNGVTLKSPLDFVIDGYNTGNNRLRFNLVYNNTVFPALNIFNPAVPANEANDFYGFNVEVRGFDASGEELFYDEQTARTPVVIAGNPDWSTQTLDFWFFPTTAAGLSYVEITIQGNNLAYDLPMYLSIPEFGTGTIPVATNAKNQNHVLLTEKYTNPTLLQTTDSTAPGFIRIPATVEIANVNSIDSARNLLGYMRAIADSPYVLWGEQNPTFHNNKFTWMDIKQRAPFPGNADNALMDLIGERPAILGFDSFSFVNHESRGLYAQDADRDTRIKLIAERSIQWVNEYNGTIHLTLHQPNYGNMVNYIRNAGLEQPESYFEWFLDDKAQWSSNSSHFGSWQTGGNTVTRIFTDPDVQRAFLEYMDIIVDYALLLQEEDIPFIFRPFHEFTGNFFWWGVGLAAVSNQNFIDMWRFTFDYFQEKGVNNAIWAYCANNLPAGTMATMRNAYPGADYVDMVGFDRYVGANASQGSNAFRADIQNISTFARETGKVAIIGEYGGYSQNTWSDPQARNGPAQDGRAPGLNAAVLREATNRAWDTANNQNNNAEIAFMMTWDYESYYPWMVSSTRATNGADSFIRNFVNDNASVFTDGNLTIDQLRGLSVSESRPANYAAVDAAIEAAEALDKDMYVSLADVDAAVAAVDRDIKINNQAKVDAYAAAILAAIAALEYKDADYSAVKDAIAAANALNRRIYIDLSKLDEVVAAVVPGLKINEQAIVDEFAAIILAEIESLELKEDTYIAEVSNARFRMVSNSNKMTTVSFVASVLQIDGTREDRVYTFVAAANNNNIEGRYTFPAGHDLEFFTIIYDIKGNGSNIKTFRF